MRYLWRILVKLEFCPQSFGKVSNIKFYRNPFELFHVDRQTGRRTDVTKLIVAIRNLNEGA